MHHSFIYKFGVWSYRIANFILSVPLFIVDRLMEELGLKVMEQSSLLMPAFLMLLKDDVLFVVRQSIVSGTNFFCSVLEEMALQVFLEELTFPCYFL